MDAEKDHTHWWAMWLALIIAAILPIIYAVLISIGFIRGAPEILLAPLLVIGVIALLVALAFTAVVFQHIGLTDKTQTLGLPEGSVRAVIALSLILIFMISAVFLYWQVANQDIETSSGITEDILIRYFSNDTTVAIRGMPMPNGQTIYDVRRTVEKSTTSEDIAKQIITTVSTLVVAVAGFYFGTKAVSTAAGVTAPSEPVIRTIDPNNGTRGNEVKVTISGKNFELGKEGKVRLVGKGATIQCTDIMSNDTTITCKFAIPKKPEESPAGKWSVVVTNADLAEDRLDDAFEVKEA